MKKKEEYIIYGLIVSAFVSISVFESLTSILLLYTVYFSVKKSINIRGKLLGGLSLYSLPTLISTSLYGSVGKAVEQSVFPFLYLLKDRVKLGLDSFKKVNLILIGIGWILAPVALYKYQFLGEYGMLWGGPFEIGMWFSLFSIASLSMFILSSKYKETVKMIFYGSSFTVFTIFALLSARRNSILGFFVTLVIMMFIYRRLIPKKILTVIFSVVLVSGLIFSLYLVKRDVRFEVLYKVARGEVSLNDETANLIASGRWQLLNEGLEVIKKDIQNLNLFNLFVGHGVGCGNRLKPKSFNGSDYESTIFISEFIVRGIFGLLGIFLMMFSYYRFIFSLKFSLVEDLLLAPSLLMLSCIFIGSIFSVFWDALLPLYLLMFGVSENYLKNRPP
ncbi:MAG: hypothetical protein N2Z80_06045 [Hydrogenothermaceae bacterium]|nr:hypothetical protein [Hydrogenothermaceae bacterium]